MAYHYENNELTDVCAMLSLSDTAAAPASREYAKRFPEIHQPGPRQLINLVQWRNRQDRTQNFRKQ
jgi:hypothetical protein